MTAGKELLQKQNIDRLEQIFYEGCKREHTKNLGVEIEHFIIDKATGDSLPFEGKNSIQTILKRLLQEYPDAVGVHAKEEKTEGASHLFGLETGLFALSLEPAAQLEISISPQESIAEIEKIYRDFRNHLDAVLQECRAVCVTTGYHPHRRARELFLIPKKRYQVMDAYFEKTGTGGIEMMRATASTQVSIDYISCSDFRKKYQAAYILTPIFKYLGQHTPVYEGEKNSASLCRTQIWNRVDSRRTGIVPGALSGRFTFRDYAAYLWEMPLVYCPQELLPSSFLQRRRAEGDAGEACAVGAQTPAQIWSEEEISTEAAWHVMSMAFPDVRLKNYIEIRGADSMPVEQAMGYISFVKGLLYQKEVTERLDREVQLHRIMECQIRRAEASIQKNGWRAEVYGQPLNDLCRRLAEQVRMALPHKEQRYLDVFAGAWYL